MPKVLVTTVPFADKDKTPIHLLEGAGIDYLINPVGRKLKEDELVNLIADHDVLIAGTEPITDKVMARANRLRLIARVGIGLDSVDLLAARRRGIRVSYTPDAPAKAVSDLTIGLMLDLLRQTHISNTQLHAGRWQRFFGRRLGEVTVGLIGMGRIGIGVLARLQGFGGTRVLVNDISPDRKLETAFQFEWAEKDRIFREADIVSVHVPLTSKTRNMIGRAELELMKPDALLVNTARGGIVNEADLYAVLQAGHLGGAAIDVFEKEPYDGPLREIERCLLTAHMGSMSVDCRARMEIEATAEAIRFLSGQALESEVPQQEYESHL
ncbi:MAG: lactate dehydrogenase [Burkholderiaceae bacterium]|nr:MAG: lactate dehydrogenase [Burkholderiaceae bacterium]